MPLLLSKHLHSPPSLRAEKIQPLPNCWACEEDSTLFSSSRIGALSSILIFFLPHAVGLSPAVHGATTKISLAVRLYVHTRHICMHTYVCTRTPGHASMCFFLHRYLQTRACSDRKREKRVARFESSRGVGSHSCLYRRPRNLSLYMCLVWRRSLCKIGWSGGFGSRRRPTRFRPDSSIEERPPADGLNRFLGLVSPIVFSRESKYPRDRRSPRLRKDLA